MSNEKERLMQSWATMVNDANNDLHDIFINIDGDDVCLRARARNLKTKNRDEMLSIIAEWQACDRAHTNHHTTKDATWSYPKFATHLVTDASGNQFPAVAHIPVSIMRTIYRVVDTEADVLLDPDWIKSKHKFKDSCKHLKDNISTDIYFRIRGETYPIPSVDEELVISHKQLGWLIFTPTFCKIIPLGYLISDDYTEYQSEMILAH